MPNFCPISKGERWRTIAPFDGETVFGRFDDDGLSRVPLCASDRPSNVPPCPFDVRPVVEGDWGALPGQPRAV